MAVEAAVVLPVAILLLIALFVGGMGVFRFQQVAAQAREAARWASVRGSAWHQETGKPSPTKQQIYDQVILPLAAGMDTRHLAIDVQWIRQGSAAPVDWDSCSKAPRSLDPIAKVNKRYVTNHVRVTVTYDWTPAIFLTGSFRLQSTSQIPMSF
jgi:Flp pilus assembly protein TadG